MAGIGPQVANSMTSFIERVLYVRDVWREEDRKRSKKCGAKTFEPRQYWYRGLSKASYDLKPGLYRKSGFEAVRKFQRDRSDEQEIQRGFKSCASQLMTETHLPEDGKGWYFLMQHYRAPTRLLDWTDGALLGLYFAVREIKKPRDAAVWILDPAWLNSMSFGDDNDSKLSGIALPEWPETDPWFPRPFEDDLHPREPIALDPPHVARRLAVQRSHFTVHGKDERGLDRLVGGDTSRLVQITIATGGIANILDDLESCGILETTIFPDLEGLSRELSRMWGG